MTNTTPPSAVPPPSEPVKNSRWSQSTIAGTVLGIALAGGIVYLWNRTTTLEGQLRDMRSAVKTEIVGLQQQGDSSSAQYGAHFAALEAKLNETGEKSQKAVSHAVSLANLNAKKVREQISQKMDEQQKVQLAQQEALTSQLGELKQDATQTSSKVTGIATEVTGVKDVVAQNKSELDKTINDLRSVRGDLGVQSGLIATNGKELAALRALGERDYVEFQLAKTKAPQKVGDVAMQLKRSDMKHNRFTIELIANDKRVEKKDRSVNEPVQFYMASARIPYEIVVNEVRNDKIVGYLAAPKVRSAR